MATDQPLDDQYLAWLYELVGGDARKETSDLSTHWHLMKHLYTTEFIWFIPNDDNRAEDGRALRWEFIEYLGIASDYTWMELGCSFLEMLIGVARRLEFEAGGDTERWFWHLIETLDISYTDRERYPKQKVQRVLDQVIWRTYDADGHGGLFPLKYFYGDQREVEIWYQLSTWVLQNS